MKINYDESIISISNSVLKHFGLSTYHKTLPELDTILETKNYKNIILYLCDGMGEVIINKHLDSDSFLRTHQLRTLSSVFPPTTTAATTSIQNGLTAYEHGWLGWDVYMKDLDKTITLFLNRVKDSTEVITDFHVGNHFMPLTTIMDRINHETRYKAYGVSPFHAIPYHLDTPDESSEIIKRLCHEDGKKFIYMYYTEPDTLMHEFGTNDVRVHQNIQAIDERIKKLSQELENSLILVTADHGHMDVRYEYLEDYPDLQSLLIRESSIEHRAVNFFVKEGCHAEFVRLFNEYFSHAFTLLSRQEVFDSGLFGSGTMHPQFEHSLGDYVALATSDIAINDRRLSYTLAAHHAGATQAELIVPLIVIDTDKV